MSKILMYIKKLFAMIASIFYGVFKPEKKIHDDNIETKEEQYSTKKKRIEKDRIIREDDESSKKRQEHLIEKEQVADYYVKRDIQRLIFIQKNVIDLEYKINKCNDIEEIYSLKKELERAKYHFNKIVNQYSEVKETTPLIKEVKNLIKESNELIKTEEKIVNKKIYNLENQDRKEEITEIVEKDFTEEEKLKDSTETVEKEKKKEEKSKKSTNLVGKEIQKKKEKPKKEKNIKIEEKAVAAIAGIATIKEVTEIPKNVEKEKDAVIRTYKVPKEKGKEDKNNINLKRIKEILLAARSVATKSNPSMLLQMNPVVAVSTSMHINNEIRRARSLTGNKVKKLKLDKIILNAGTNPKNQVKLIMTNSLSEIRKLKEELKKYGTNQEVIDALTELTELELEVLMQLNELQLQNTNIRHR